jgi:glutaredoxin-like YruB-family protein
MLKKVTVYSTATCPYCKIEKQWLEKNDIKYENFFVDENEAAADKMIKLSGQMGVPVTVIHGAGKKEAIIVGFDKTKLAAALGISV